MNDDEAIKLISNARTRLLIHCEPFLAHIALTLSLKIDNDDFMKTCYTDGRALAFNTDFVATMIKEQRVGLVAHEVLHLVFGHLGRSEGKDIDLWLMATDFVVNDYVAEMSKGAPEIIALIPNPCYDRKYHNWTAEQVYADLKEHYKSRKPRNIDNLPSSGNTRSKDSSKKSKSKEQQSNGDQDNQEQNGGAQTKEKSKVCGTAAQKLSKPEIERIKRQITTIAEVLKRQGKLPGKFEELVKLMRPQVDWRTVLASFLVSCLADYSFERPDRRMFAHNIYLPSVDSEEKMQLFVAIDTSGSMSIKQIQQGISEVKSIVDLYPHIEGKMIQCDAAIQDISPIDAELIKIRGRGGTNFIPVFEKIQGEYWRPDLLVYFTDGYGVYPKIPPSYPVLWCYTRDHKEAPFGKEIIMDI